MALDPSVTAALKSLRARRDSIDRAITALLALQDADGANSGASAAAANSSEAPQRRSGRAGRTNRTGRSKPSVGGGVGGVRKVLHESPGRGFTASQLAHAMQANGWVTDSAKPRAAARASANRLRQETSEHVFFENGEYVYRPPSTELEGLHEATQGDGDP